MKSDMDAVNDFMKRLLDVLSGKSSTCLRCGAAVERFDQVGRDVYARPCGCRQYQGKAPETTSKGSVE